MNSSDTLIADVVAGPTPSPPSKSLQKPPDTPWYAGRLPVGFGVGADVELCESLLGVVLGGLDAALPALGVLDEEHAADVIIVANATHASHLDRIS